LHKLADENLVDGLKSKLNSLEREINKQEYKVFLSGKYDKNNAILEIFSGAGGVDAQDWVTMLLRMYQRYCQVKGFKIEILHQAFGESGGPDGRIGTKSVTLEIQGKYAYGLLKRESGVHRLVRISPFSSQKLRHTSFASVQVLPELEDADENIEIKPDDLIIDTFKAGGPGGQYTNKTESAIRITHLPTGIVVTSQVERLQGKNKETAMKVLKSKIFQLKQKEKEKEIKKIKGNRVLAEFGSQTRNYVLHPYKLVKDLRTQYETSNAEAVLEGDLEEFIQAELKL
jgi:peptide chain release factor 2